MKYVITGVLGSGKSAIGRLLKDEGYKVIDVDYEPGLAEWVDKKTGEPIRSSKNNPPEWYETHDWVWNRDKLKQLLNDSSHNSIFICGITSNQTENLDLFDKIFLLKANELVLRDRLANRGDQNINQVFDWQNSFEDEMIKHGAVVIDANKSLDEVYSQIISIIQK